MKPYLKTGEFYAYRSVHALLLNAGTQKQTGGGGGRGGGESEVLGGGGGIGLEFGGVRGRCQDRIHGEERQQHEGRYREWF